MSEKEDEAAAKKVATDELANKQAAGELAAKLAADESAAKQAGLAVVADKTSQDDAEIEETLDATVAAGTAAPSLQSPSEKGYDPSQYQDKTRSYIAYWLLGLLTVIELCGFLMLFAVKEPTFDNLKSILEILFGPVVALVSAATGFYFGAQQPKKQ
ncbi:hypothetical protein ACFOLJ_27385 [Rugamonas sp. CCM 8940]|uniref:hypothetical protein n=1 Tax=Rugamonas sp. CCM 8940 TaxID=2765359 RepID=UPI001F27E11F|nr:hypothetical protein [Rugamonas sp. CCM 8940]